MLKHIIACLVFSLLLFSADFAPAGETEKTAPDPKPVLKVVATLPDYASIAGAIGGNRCEITHIVRGDQDAHFIRPKPSFITMVAGADVLISTGLDLELWLPSVIDKSGNTKIRSEQAGYVAASDGMKLLEIPEAASRMEGGVHVYGNPHVTCSPVNMKIAAKNIAAGLIKNDSEGKEFYLNNLKNFENEIDEQLFGKTLVELLGGKTLCKLAEKGKLIPFLKEKKYKKKPLTDYLGGWMKKMLPLAGKKYVTYHKNWIYFSRLFGLIEAGQIEPKPGIPPSAKHVAEIIKTMKENDVKIIFAASYYNQEKAKDVADKTGSEAVIVPAYVGGIEEVSDYFQLVDYWVDNLLKAAKKKGVVHEEKEEK